MMPQTVPKSRAAVWAGCYRWTTFCLQLWSLQLSQKMMPTRHAVAVRKAAFQNVMLTTLGRDFITYMHRYSVSVLSLATACALLPPAYTGPAPLPHCL